MSVVTVAEAWPAGGRPFTVAELDRMPDDGRRYEPLDGALVVNPRSATIHQVVVGRLRSAGRPSRFTGKPWRATAAPTPAVRAAPATAATGATC